MFKHIILLLFICLISCGRGFKDYSAVPIDQVDFLNDSETKTENNISVTTSVLTDKESNDIFGVDLFRKGIQPVWISITNKAEDSYAFLPISVDPDYFAPNEVAYLFQGLFGGGQIHPQLSERFNKYGFEFKRINPGETREGFVYTNFDPGIKYINITLAGYTTIETFVFYLVLDDSKEEFEKIDFTKIYSENEIANYTDENEFVLAVKALNCCIESGINGDNIYPINFIFIGNDEDIFSALIRRGWDVTEPYSDKWKKINKKEYFSTSLFRTTPMGNYFFFDRMQDVSLQKSRKRDKGTLRQRNEMRMWLAPIKFSGKNVWLGSTTRDIGTDVDKVKDFLTKKIDPDLNETRAFLAEDMLVSQSVNKIGFIGMQSPSDSDNPNSNINNQKWWSDGMVLVLHFEDTPNTLSDIKFYDWEFPDEYIRNYYREMIDTKPENLE